MFLTLDHLTFRLEPPDPHAFIELRAACGWGDISLETAEQALNRSVFDVTCFDSPHLVAIGRVVGDGALYFYLQDIVVRAAYQNQSLGKDLMRRLLEQTTKRAAAGATIGLMCAYGKEGFYEKFGFTQRPSEKLGAGMTMFLR